MYIFYLPWRKALWFTRKVKKASWEHPDSDNNFLTVQWPHSESEPGPGPGQGCVDSASDEANTPPSPLHPPFTLQKTTDFTKQTVTLRKLQIMNFLKNTTIQKKYLRIINDVLHFIFSIKRLFPVFHTMHAAFGMTFNYNLEVEGPHSLFPALEYCISWHHTLLSLHWLLLLSIEGVDGYHRVHLGLPVWRHRGALVLGQNLPCGLY